MRIIPNRVVIYTKDVVNITGLSDRTARHMLSIIRKKNNKPPSSLISIHEFCQHTGLKEEIIIPFML
jgi:hypothetical protein